jgi:hypothetical protein
MPHAAAHVRVGNGSAGFCAGRAHDDGLEVAGTAQRDAQSPEPLQNSASVGRNSREPTSNGHMDGISFFILALLTLWRDARSHVDAVRYVKCQAVTRANMGVIFLLEVHRGIL